MKTAELEGAELDYWVYHALHGKHLADFTGGAVPFSSDWRQGGPIIDSADIWFEKSNWTKDPPVFAYIKRGDDTVGQFGRTRLEAAMRCKVASVYGDEVPDQDK